MTNHPLPRNIPPAGDLEQVETSLGKMDRWKARALALAEIQSVVNEVAQLPRRRADAVENDDQSAALRRGFRDAVAQIRSIRDRQMIMRKLDELENRIDMVAKREAAYDALLKAEALFTSPDDDNADSTLKKERQMDAHLEPTGTHALWDETFQKLGRSAPPQRADKSIYNYQRRLAELGSRYVPRGEQIAGVDFAQLPNEVVPKFSEMMRERVEANMRRTDNLDPNDTNYRTVLVTDANTNGKIKEFYQSPTFHR